MAKIAQKVAAKTSVPAVAETDYESFAFNVVEITKGTSFPKGKKFDCVKSGVSKRTKRPYCMIMDGETMKFVDPRNIVIVSAIPAAKRASYEAQLEADKEATVYISASVVEERETAVRLRHGGWRDIWVPKSFLAVQADNGTEVIYEIPRWKVISSIGQDAFSVLEEKQEAFTAIVEAANQPAPPVTTLIKKASLVKKLAK